VSIEKEKRLLFGKGRWIWQGSADGSLPIVGSVDKHEDKVDQIFVDSSLEGEVFI